MTKSQSKIPKLMALETMREKAPIVLLNISASLLLLFLGACNVAPSQKPTAMVSSTLPTITTPPLPATTVLPILTLTKTAPPLPSATKFPPQNSPIAVSNVASLQLLVSRKNGEFTNSEPPLNNQVAFTSDGQLVGVASRNGVFFYSANSLEELRHIETSDEILTLAFSPDGKVLATGSILHTLDPKDNTLQLWRVSDGTLLRTIHDQENQVNSVAFSPDGQFLASGGWPDDAMDIRVRLWQAADSNLVRTLMRFGESGGPIQSLEFSPDSQILAGGASDGLVRLWQVSTGKGIQILDGNTAPSGSITGINTVEAFSPNGKIIALAANYDILLRKVSDGSLLQILKGHMDCLNSLTFSPDGQLLASASWDKTVRLWRVSDGRLVRTLNDFAQAVNSVDFSPNGHTLVVGTAEGTIQLWGVLP